MKQYNLPVLIIGAGAAGVRAGIAIKQAGVTPLILGKRDHGDAHTTWARGGINASLGNLDEEDSWQIHAADTLDEGHHINDAEAVETMAKQMPEIARELDDWGMDFSRTESGEINQRYFGAQSFRRTCFAGDYTGEALLNTLVGKAKDMNIPYKENLYITKLLSDDETVYGAVGYNFEDEEFNVFYATHVILAAGGYTSLYNRHSSRDDENTGDGIGLAHDAGAELMDMEFVQFHPTGMAGERYGDEWDGRLVTEAVRGEGGHLYNSEENRFMKNYSPKQMELDARDVVARAIAQEIREGRGTGNEAVYLDISHKNEEFIQERLPRMYERFQKLGVNIAEEPMEVAPTAHYGMGGVRFDATTGETNISNLHVLGETTAGVHGANRLGGNSLAETVSIGAEVGEYIGSTQPEKRESIPEEVNWMVDEEVQRVNRIRNRDDGRKPSEVITRIRRLLEKHAGIRRSEDSLKQGLEELEQLKMTRVSADDDDELEKALNVKWMLIGADSILRGALRRTESRGAHYRTDYPDADESQRHNIVYDSSEHLRKIQPTEPSEEVREAVGAGYSLDYHHLE